jgi:hypothetical protein
LLAALGPDRDAAANRYLEIHTNLVRLFDWRGCAAPDEYADEAISRCARKIGEGDEIRDVQPIVSALRGCWSAKWPGRSRREPATSKTFANCTVRPSIRLPARSLARVFGIPASTSHMRALRLRERLQSCAQDCVSRAGVGPV